MNSLVLLGVITQKFFGCFVEITMVVPLTVEGVGWVGPDTIGDPVVVLYLLTSPVWVRRGP